MRNADVVSRYCIDRFADLLEAYLLRRGTQLNLKDMPVRQLLGPVVPRHNPRASGPLPVSLCTGENMTGCTCFTFLYGGRLASERYSVEDPLLLQRNLVLACRWSRLCKAARPKQEIPPQNNRSVLVRVSFSSSLLGIKKYLQPV